MGNYFCHSGQSKIHLPAPVKKVTVLPCLGFYLVLFSGPENLRASSFNRYAIICIAVFNGLVESHSCWFCLDHNVGPKKAPVRKAASAAFTAQGSKHGRRRSDRRAEWPKILQTHGRPLPKREGKVPGQPKTASDQNLLFHVERG